MLEQLDNITISNIHSEEDVKHHIVIPVLNKLGYSNNQISLNVPIKAYFGGKTKIIYADLLVKDNKNDTPLIIIETKKPGIQLDEIHKEQAISYARQYESPVPFAVVTNGAITKVYNVITKQQIPEIPKKEEIISKVTKIQISQSEIDEAGRFIIEGYKNVQDIRTALNKCHDIIRGNDGLDPLSSFDEINKIIYTRIQEEKYANANNKTNRFNHYYFDNEPDPIIAMNNIFNNAIEMLGKHKIFDENEKINLSADTIKNLVSILEKKSISLTDTDIIGLAYESFLPNIFRGERLGQFFTPDRIKDFMLDFLDPKIGNIIIDPAFGSGGFLVISFKRLLNSINNSGFDKEKQKLEKQNLCEKYLMGVEINPRLAIASKTNMYLHGDGKTNLFRGDGLINIDDIIVENKFDIVVTNPPFGASIDRKEILEKFTLGNGRNKQASEILFLERCVRLAKKDTGRIGIVLPESILMNTSFKYVRDWLDNNVTIDAIFKMPNFAFNPSGAGISTSLIFMTRKKTDINDYKIFMGNVDRIGYDQNNRPDKDDLPEAYDNYKKYKFKKQTNFNSDKYYVIDKNAGKLLSVNFYLPKYTKLLDKIKQQKNIKLVDICRKEKYSIVDGPFGTQLHVSDYTNSGNDTIPLFRVQNIGVNEFIENNLVYITKEKHREIIRSKVCKDDIIITKTGTIGRACVFPFERYAEANITASCCKISVDTNIADPYFIAELINTDIVGLQLERYSIKSVQPGFNLIELREVLIPYISINDQRAIAKDIIEKKKNITKLKNKILQEQHEINNIIALQ